MSRRHARLGRRNPPIIPVVATDTITALLPFARWRADTGVVTGATMTWTDSIGGYVLSQSTGSAQPTPKASTTELNSKESLTFDGTTDCLNSTAAASVWKFLHDGTGQETYVWLVCRATSPNPQPVWGTGPHPGQPSLNTGAYRSLYRDPYSSLQIHATNATRVVGSDYLGAPTIGAGACIGSSYKEGSSPEWRNVVTGTVVASGNSGIAPSSSDPTQTLFVGGGINGWYFTGDIAEILIFNRELTAGERTIVGAYGTSRYSVGW